MNNDEKNVFRKNCIIKLTDSLTMLRAKTGASQAEIAEVIGIARQTYSAIESGRKNMSWNTFMSLILFFKENTKTRDILNILGIYTNELERYIKIEKMV